MNLPVFVEVLQPLQHFFQDGGDACLIQHSGLVLTTRDDMLDDVQHRACKSGTGMSPHMLAVHGGNIQFGK